MLTLDTVYQASYKLREVIRTTDMIKTHRMFGGDEVYLKTENLQVTGSFKVRGAYYRMSRLTDAQKRAGVIACSAGNHAQGVALAAARQGIDSVICIPEGAPLSKIEATRGYGANVVLVKGVYDDAYQKALDIAAETGRTMIHPFNDEDVIAGQGTIGLEILDQIPDVDVVIVAVGGGGLLAGVAFTIKQLKPEVKVYGVEAAGAASMLHSFKEGKIDALPSVQTIADGIAVKVPGNLTYEYCLKYVDGIVTVTDDEVACAILDLLERQKLVTEGAGAVAVAAALFGKIDIRGKKTCCLLSGGNIDVQILSRVISRGLLREGRSYDFTLQLEDRPGQLTRPILKLRDVISIVSRSGANITGVIHDRGGSGTDMKICTLRISLETRDPEHVSEIRKAITAAGYEIISEVH